MTDFEDVVGRIRDAIGADPDEPVIIRTPQFERRDDVDPADPPLTPTEFDALRTLNDAELKSLGLRPWSKDSDLYLLPAEWFPHIPQGVTVTDIFGDREAFDPSTKSDDRRFGVLAYGVVPDWGDPPEQHDRPITKRE